MRKLLLGAAATLITIGAFAQGTVIFGNATSVSGITPGNRQVTWGQTVRVLSPFLPGTHVCSNSANFAGFDFTGLRVALVYAPSTITDLKEFQLATFNGGFPTFKSSTSATAGSWYTKTATLNGVTAGQTVNMAAMVWDINLAASPLDAAARLGLVGESAVFSYTVPAGSTPAPSEFVAQGLTAFEVNWVPEPTSFALFGFGAAAMMIFRRRGW